MVVRAILDVNLPDESELRLFQRYLLVTSWIVRADPVIVHVRVVFPYCAT